MANLIETAMHVLSYFCIFVIYGSRLGAGRTLNVTRSPRRRTKIDAPRASRRPAQAYMSCRTV